MAWPKSPRSRHGDTKRTSHWSPEESAMIASAVSRAPSVHNTQPWSLDLHGRSATLHERSELALSRHDPDGRDRHISCGAALTNLVVAVRSTGWRADVQRGGTADQPDVVATVTGTRRIEPTPADHQRYRAIVRRMSYRRPFEDHDLPHVTREALHATAKSAHTAVRWVTGQHEALELARLLIYTARAYSDDAYYQRELSMWLSEGSDEPPDEGIPAAALGAEGIPALGLATPRTRFPDERNLAARIDSESVLVLSTPSDEYEHHVEAGEAVERTWLEATGLGLVGSLMTQPLHLSEVRTGLAKTLGLAGVPQVLMRFGYASAIPTPRTSRRPQEELFADDQEDP